MARGLLKCPADESPKCERKRKHDVAVRDRDHGGHCTGDDHRGLPRDRRLRPWLQRSPGAPQGLADRARRTDRRRDARARLSSQGELAPSKSGRKGPPKGGPFVVLWAEELPFEVFERPLKR